MVNKTDPLSALKEPKRKVAVNEALANTEL